MPVNFNDTRTQKTRKDFNCQASHISNQFKNKMNTFSSSNTNLIQLREDKLELSTAVSKNDKCSANDGKISQKDKLINFAKGIINPITNVFKSPKNFLIGIGMTLGISTLTVATGGAIAPLLVTIGIISGSIQLANSVYKAGTAKTDDEAKNAWQGLGTGIVTVASSITGAKAAAKSFNIKGSNNMNPLQATVACIKNTPKAISNSLKGFANGKILLNLKLKENKIKNSIKNNKNKPIKKEENNSSQKVTETKTNKEEPSIQDMQAKRLHETKTDNEIILNQNTEQKVTIKTKPKEEQIKSLRQNSDIETKEKIVLNTKQTTKPIEETIIKRDGTKVTIKRNQDGTLFKSTIKKDDITTNKYYKQNKCFYSEIENDNCFGGYKRFKYNSDGKISEIEIVDPFHEIDGIKKFEYTNNKTKTSFIENIPEDISNVRAKLKTKAISNTKEFHSTSGYDELLSLLEKQGLSIEDVYNDLELVLRQERIGHAQIYDRYFNMIPDTEITPSTTLYHCTGETAGKNIIQNGFDLSKAMLNGDYGHAISTSFEPSIDKYGNFIVKTRIKNGTKLLAGKPYGLTCDKIYGQNLQMYEDFKQYSNLIDNIIRNKNGNGIISRIIQDYYKEKGYSGICNIEYDGICKAREVAFWDSNAIEILK